MNTNFTLIGFLTLYVRKMLQDRHDGLPFLRYEDFTASPETTLHKIFAHLGFPWSPRVLLSHKDYGKSQIGYGGIKFCQPIKANSIDKYQKLEPWTQAIVYNLAHEVFRQYGYTWDGKRVGIMDVAGLL